MRHLALRITLLDAVVLSEREATGGGHRTLRYLPGSVLLGAAAGRLYRRLSAEDAFLAFHSGRMRFLSGLPSVNGHDPAWPVPICLHRDKLEKGSEVFNACIDLPKDNRQLVAEREGFIALNGNNSGTHVKPQTFSVTKTAIDASRGSAAESQLFTYECLAPGQVFIAGVEVDPEVPSALFEQVIAALTGEVRIGRSRSAEFGRVVIERIEASKTDVDVSSTPTDEGAVWLLSDLAVLDAWGQPTVQPSAADLSLPGRIDWSRSFVRTRRYAPWNAHRGGFDAERLLLQAGSVLWITEAKGRLLSGQRSVGRYTEAGLGRVWVAPPMLRESRLDLDEFKGMPKTSAKKHDIQATTPKAATTTTPLLSWFTSRSTRTGSAATQDASIDALVSTIEALYGHVIDELAPADGVLVGPSSSQWRDVARLAETVEGKDPTTRGSALMDELFGANSKLIKRPGWRDPYWDSKTKNRLQFHEGVKAALVQAKLGDALPAVISLLARRMSKHSVVGVRNENRGSSDSKLQEVRR